MNVHHLELFYYVARYEGITRAVRRMPYGIQQPAVSGQILELEKELGVKLFQRRPFKLTPAGRELYDFATPFFSQLDEVSSRLREEGAAHLRLAAAPSFLTNHLPAVLEALKQRVPELRLTLREVTPEEAGRLLTNQEVDVAISLHRDHPTPPVRLVELMRLPVVLLAPPGAKHKTLAALVKSGKNGGIKEPLITLISDEVLTQLFLDTLEQRGLSWSPTIEVNTLALVHAYVSRGFGYGVTVGVPVVETPENVRVIRLPKFPQLVVGFSYTGDLNPVAALFLEEARGYVKELAEKTWKK
jgi:DNA-binding transcriptional LysR family regulator